MLTPPTSAAHNLEDPTTKIDIDKNSSLKVSIEDS